LWWDVDGCNDDRTELPWKIKWTARDRQILQVQQADIKSVNILRVAPLVVDHETNPSTLGVT